MAHQDLPIHTDAGPFPHEDHNDGGLHFDVPADDEHFDHDDHIDHEDHADIHNDSNHLDRAHVDTPHQDASE